MGITRAQRDTETRRRTHIGRSVVGTSTHGRSTGQGDKGSCVGGRRDAITGRRGGNNGASGESSNFGHSTWQRLKIFVICLGNEWEFTLGGAGWRLKAPGRYEARGIGAAKHQRQSSAAGRESHVRDSHGDICLKTQHEEPCSIPRRATSLACNRAVPDHAIGNIRNTRVGGEQPETPQTNGRADSAH